MKKKMVIWGIVLTVCGIGYAGIGKYFVGSIFIITRPIRGVVVDKETGKPIEGAYVDCVWSGYRASIGDSEDVEIGHRMVVTDKEGKFKIKGIFRIFPFAYYNPENTFYRGGAAECKIITYAYGYKHSEPSKVIDPEYAKACAKAWGLHNITRTAVTGIELAKALEPFVIVLKPIKNEEDFYEYLCGFGDLRCGFKDTIGDIIPLGRDAKSFYKFYKFRYEFIINVHKRFLELYPKSKYAPEVHACIVASYTRRSCTTPKIWLKHRELALKEYQKMVELYSESHECVKDAKECIEQTDIYFGAKKK